MPAEDDAAPHLTGAGPQVVLDITRLVTQTGRHGPTGIDRVEAAWLGHLLTDARSRFLCQTRWGLLVLGPASGRRVLRAMGFAADGQGEDPTLTAMARQPARRLRRHLFMTGLARDAAARARRDEHGLPAALQAAGVGRRAVYLNTGHANLGAAQLCAMPLRKAVMVHDTIPLDHPEWTAEAQVPRFRERLQAVFAHADMILTVSRASAARLRFWMGRLGVTRPVSVLAAHIGCSITPPDPAQPLPPAPWFLALGTIEPRKNHALLLDAWGRMGPVQAPHLVIAGARGWRNEDVFARLDALQAGDPIREVGGLGDAGVAALIAGARALLFPSRAEGFGMPLTEAAARGVPVLGLDLPSTKEILGDYVQYLPDDPAAWAEAVMRLANQPLRRLPVPALPGWAGHFREVGTALAQLSKGEVAG